jgi:hypothetical protein
LILIGTGCWHYDTVLRLIFPLREAVFAGESKNHSVDDLSSSYLKGKLKAHFPVGRGWLSAAIPQ